MWWEACGAVGIIINTLLHMPRVALAFKCAREGVCVFVCACARLLDFSRYSYGS